MPYPAEHPTLLLKKARLFVAGGVAEDDDLEYHLVFWFAIHQYGRVSKGFKYFHPSLGVDDPQCGLRPEPETNNAIKVKDATHFQRLLMEHFNLEFGKPQWREMIRKCLPLAYQEGTPNWYGGMGSGWTRKDAPYGTLVPITPIPHDIARPTGDPEEDKQITTTLLKRIREGIWHAPIEDFTEWMSGKIAYDVLEMMRGGSV